MSTWPFPGGQTPRPAVDHPLRPEAAAHTSCPRCSSTNLRPNGRHTNALGLTRQAVECRDCSRGFYLPYGVRLPRVERVRKQEAAFILADDARPNCPFCGARD